MTDDAIWRKRMAAKLVDAAEKVLTDTNCKGALIMLAMQDGSEMYVNLQSNGGDEWTPEDMARAMKSCAPSMAKKAYEVKDSVQ